MLLCEAYLKKKQKKKQIYGIKAAHLFKGDSPCAIFFLSLTENSSQD